MKQPLKRGDIFDVDFSAAPGGMQDVRPAIIIQNNIGNEYAPYTIIAAIHHDEKKPLPVLVGVPRGVAGLSKDSVIDCAHLATLPKDQLRHFRGQLPGRYQSLVDDALKISLGLG